MVDLLAQLADRLDPPPNRYLTDPASWVKDRLGEHFWSKQVEIAESLAEHRRTAVQACHGVGKALRLSTRLPTPTGWTTMGDVAVGDLLLDEHGRPVRVVDRSEIHDRDVLEVTFDDGETIVASDDHLWQVLPLKTRSRLRGRARAHGAVCADWRDRWDASETVTTRTLAARVRTGIGQCAWAVPTTRPLAGTPAVMPVPPYALGYWLGDGHSHCPNVTVAHTDTPNLHANLAAEGVTVREVPSQHRDSTTVYRYNLPRRALDDLGVRNNKHVPAVALRADIDTRLAVLAGILDSDGFVMAGGMVGLDVTDRHLADTAAELIATFGWKVRRSEGRATLYGKDCGPKYRLNFRPDRQVFRLPRKAALLRPPGSQRSRHTARTIVDVRPAGREPVRCVTVDSPTSLYLAGMFIPTHNSFSAARFIAWWLDVHPPGEAFVVSTAPTAKQVEAVLWREINKAAKKADPPLLGRVLTTEWKLGNELIGYGRKPADTDPTAFQGIHARYVLVVIDEACGIPKDLWIAAGALATNTDCRILAIGNPDDPGSHFASVCRPDSGWHVIRVNAFDSPNFTDEPVPDELRPMLVSETWVSEMRSDVGEGSGPWMSKVLGLFPTDADDTVVRISAARACMTPGQQWSDDRLLPVELGVDVGAGGDMTVVRERRGIRAGRVWRKSTPESTQVVNMVLDAIAATEATAVKVDAIGVGWAVAGRLTELGEQGAHKARIVPVNVGAQSTLPERFPRLRDQLWWEVGRVLCEDRAWDLADIDDRTLADLTSPKYGVDLHGRVKVEPKQETRQRLGRSPDDADALLLAFYRGNRGPTFLFTNTDRTVGLDGRPLAEERPDGHALRPGRGSQQLTVDGEGNPKFTLV